MSFLTGLRCLRCGTEYPVSEMTSGCPRCAATKPASVTPTYDYAAIGAVLTRKLIADRPPTMWRYQELLPPRAESVVSLGEGMTPLHHCRALGQKLGLTRLYVKNDTVNPTWSFKDRLASSAVSMARQLGARLLAVTSSGNAGAAAAAYAAAAGIDCLLFTTQSFPLATRVQMQAYGAKVVAAPTALDRWRFVRICVDELGAYPVANYADPPVGSNPFGVDGCKSIAYEIAEQLGWRSPDRVVVPVAYGDAFHGIWKGFGELRDLGFVDRAPQMVAAEVFGSLANALAGGLDHVQPAPAGPTIALSAGAVASTYQALKALQESAGIAGIATDEEMIAMQRELACSEGIYAEPSSVLTLAYLKKLREQGRVDRDDLVVCLLTAAGLKDPEVTRQAVPEIPLVEPSLAGLRESLASAYGYELPESREARRHG